jgi:hypothetical protein
MAKQKIKEKNKQAAIEKSQKKIIAKETKVKEKKEKLQTEDEEISKFFQLGTKRFPPSDVEHDIFVSIPDDKRINIFTESGLRVLVATYPAHYAIYFLKYIELGTQFFPNGGIKVYNSTNDQVQYFCYDAVAIHPTKKDKFRVATIE